MTGATGVTPAVVDPSDDPAAYVAAENRFQDALKQRAAGARDTDRDREMLEVDYGR